MEGKEQKQENDTVARDLFGSLGSSMHPRGLLLLQDWLYLRYCELHCRCVKLGSHYNAEAGRSICHAIKARLVHWYFGTDTRHHVGSHGTGDAHTLSEQPTQAKVLIVSEY
jgi:hypothetical protein